VPKKRTTRPGSHSRPSDVESPSPSSNNTPTRLERPEKSAAAQDKASTTPLDNEKEASSGTGKLLIVAGIAIAIVLALLVPKLLSSDAEPAATAATTPAVTPAPVAADARPAPVERHIDQIQITSSPPGATIEYMGNRYTAPITIGIEMGSSRTVLISKDGYRTSTLVVAKGQKIARVELLAVVAPDAGPPERKPTGIVKDKRPATRIPTKTPTETPTKIPTKIPTTKPPATSTDNPNPWAQ
ncbi:MAG: hypothetical protein JKY56_19890, partial [Kofleriaceae bacterium]|nr:hypothetical protein [Kofleriaceae bacterium]